MPATVFDKPMFPGAKLISSQITVTNTSGSYSQVITDERITAHMSAARVEVEDGTIFGGKITIASANGSYTISCPSVSGSTTVKVFFLKTTDDPTIVTSAEFDILNNRMNALENADIRYSVTIPTSGWTLSDGEYIYIWSNVMITSGAAVDAEFLEDDGDLDIEGLEFEKVSGGVKFTSPFIPNDDIPVSIRVINARFNLESDITAEQVSTSAVSGASNVDEALTALNSKLISSESLTSIDQEVSIPEGTSWIIINMYYDGGEKIHTSTIKYPLSITLNNNNPISVGFTYYISSTYRFMMLASIYNGKIKAYKYQVNGNDQSLNQHNKFDIFFCRE